MSLTPTIAKHLIKRKLATAVLVGASLAAFATLGDGGKKDKFTASSAISTFTARSFSLRSGYNYRSNNFLTPSSSDKFIMLNTVVTYQKGNATFILPLKKKVFLGDKIKLNPLPPKF